MFQGEPRSSEVGVESLQRVPTRRAEADDGKSVGDQMGRNPSEHLRLGPRRHEGQDVSGKNGGIERLRNASGRQIELGQIGDDPARSPVVLSGRGDQVRVRVDPDDSVTSRVQDSTNAPGTAAGVQDARARRGHRIEQPSLPAEVDTVGGHSSEPFDVPLGVTVIGVGDPAGGEAHGRHGSPRALGSMSDGCVGPWYGRLGQDGHRETKGSLVNTEQFEKIKGGNGFIAALDQSGGSTPKALMLYGLDGTAYANEAEMFDRMHEMRSRIITSPSFTGDRILGAILFEMTMEREIQGKGSAEYLWQDKHVVPFLKVDKGLADEVDGAQVMKPMPDLDALLSRANAHGVFGTKMRSVIKLANPSGVNAVVDQQFEVGRQILGAGLVPIIEPEVDINSPQKAAAEELLKAGLVAALDRLGADAHVMLKLTLPEQDGFYTELIQHPRVLRVVALSGGYTRDDANARLARNHGVVASFSRALTEGLTAQQSDAEFDAALDASIASIYAASVT